MIIYIHGFGSSGFGHKANQFREYFKSKNIPFIAPSLSTIPTLAIQTLEELIESYDEVQLIGSSLGGFYSLYLSKKYNLKSVLINPSIYPYKTLKKVLNKGLSYYDGTSYEWNSNHISMLHQFEIDILDEKNIRIYLQKGDKDLDYKEAVKKLSLAKHIIEEGGTHSFENMDRHFDDIVDFFTH